MREIKKPKRDRPRALDEVKATLPNPREYNNPDRRHPVFCFQYIDRDFGADHKSLSKTMRANLLVRLQALSTMTWEQLRGEHPHGYGYELINLSQLRKNLPKELPIKPDASMVWDKVWVFRLDSDNHVFAGLRIQDVFHVLFIEHTFNSLYSHDGKNIR